jgi:hypothetical protein
VTTQKHKFIDGNNYIKHQLKHNIPFAAGKIGGNELMLLWFHNQKHCNWNPQFHKDCEQVAGLYPTNVDTVNWFASEIYSNLKYLDLIAPWSKTLPEFEDYVINHTAVNAYRTLMEHLEPYFFDTPWTECLSGKNVVVFSPFADSISQNYKNFNNIWNGKIAANFNLISIKYPTSIPITHNSPHTTSFEIYNKYIDILHDTDFDVGIFGTGHTGLLFASECKKMGRTGIHMGGATQILFGIKGDRWSNRNNFTTFFNKHWTHPMESETPEHYKQVEGGCYW